MNLDIYRELLRKVEIIDTRLVNLSSLEDLICFEENTGIDSSAFHYYNSCVFHDQTGSGWAL